MPHYSVSSINHLCERFATRQAEHACDEAAIEAARCGERAYPLEVMRLGACIAMLPATPWRMEDWIARAIALPASPR